MADPLQYGVPASPSASSLPLSPSRSTAAAASIPPSPSSSPVMFDVIRNEVFRHHFRQRRRQFVQTRAINIWSGTWNLAGKKPPSSGYRLDDWLLANGIHGASFVPDCDIYALGFQEVVALNPQSMLVEKSIAENNAPWERMVQTTLTDQYQLVCSQQLVGVMLLVYIRRAIMPFVRDVQWDSLGIGILGVGGNKGGIACRLQVFDSTICIICAHLAADQNNVKGRNGGYRAIAEQIQFNKPRIVPLSAVARPSLRSVPFTPPSSTSASSSSSSASSSSSITSSISSSNSSDPILSTDASSGAFLSASTSPVESIGLTRSSSFSIASTSTSSVLDTPVEFPDLPCFHAIPGARIIPSLHAADDLPIAPRADASPVEVSMASLATSSTIAAHVSAASIPGAYCTPAYLAPRTAIHATKTDTNSDGNNSNGSGSSDKIDIWDHEHIIFVGDLNYRLDLKDHTYVFGKIDEKDYASLQTHDQLTKERLAGRAFVNFNEAPLQFAPTYKYRLGTSVYAFGDRGKQDGVIIDDIDTSTPDNNDIASPLTPSSTNGTSTTTSTGIGGSGGKPKKALSFPFSGSKKSDDAKQAKEDKKQRMPAWTDRILWYSRPRMTSGQLATEIESVECNVRDPERKVLEQDVHHRAHHPVLLAALARYDGRPRLTCVSYGRVERTESDHRPVYARLTLQVDVCWMERLYAIYDAVTQHINIWLGSHIPRDLWFSSTQSQLRQWRDVRRRIFEEEEKKANSAGAMLKKAGGVGGGVFVGATALTSGLSTGLAHLSMDQSFVDRHKTSTEKRTGFIRGVQSLGLGVMNGITGLVVDPYNGAKKQGAKGFFIGMGKGLLGVVTKPTVGALDFTTKTLQGIHDGGKKVATLIADEVNKDEIKAAAIAAATPVHALHMTIMEWMALPTSERSRLLWDSFTSDPSIGVMSKAGGPIAATPVAAPGVSIDSKEIKLMDSPTSSNSSGSMIQNHRHSGNASQSPSSDEHVAWTMRLCNDRTMLLASASRLACFELTSGAPAKSSVKDAASAPLLSTTLIFHVHIWEITHVTTYDNILQLHTITEAKKLVAAASASQIPPSSSSSVQDDGAIAAATSPAATVTVVSSPPVIDQAALAMASTIVASLPLDDNRGRTVNLPSQLLIECRDTSQARDAAILLQAYLAHAPLLFGNTSPSAAVASAPTGIAAILL